MKVIKVNAVSEKPTETTVEVAQSVGEASDNNRFIVVGKISAPYGVKGWVKVHSYTQPMNNIINYTPWYMKYDGQWQNVAVVSARLHGKSIVAQLYNTETREQAELLKGCEIAVDRNQLPEPEAGSYYWIDLIGLRVVNVENIDLGVVERLIETGANDVLVVQGDRERLIPYVKGEMVLHVDLKTGVMRVDWDADF